MCTIVVARASLPDTPLVVAANRDEQYDRPSRPPARIEESPSIVAPLDLRAGGTWVGINENGVVAALANRSDGPGGERSRGWLVRSALQCETVAAACDRIQTELEDTTYAGCFLVIVDRTQATCLRWDGALTVESLDPGLHVLVNAGLNEPDKAARIRERIAAWQPTDREAWIGRLRELLGCHEIGACIHRGGAGTRSSSIFAVGNRTMTYEFADGAPCRTPYHRIVKWEV